MGFKTFLWKDIMKKYPFICDADEILYAAAFTAEQTAYKIIIKDKEYDLGTKYNRNQILEKLNEKGKVLNEDYTLVTYKVPTGPKEFAMTACGNIIHSLEKISSDLKLFLTSDDKSNFRFKVATTPGPNGPGYKAGRPARPIYYKECRDYLLRWGAEEVFGMEADDALGINQTNETVLVHQDKDINRIMGRHYNWKTKERYLVRTKVGELHLDEKKRLRGTGNAWFFAQMLLGDRVDNIPTVIGHSADMAVYNILKGCKTELDYFKIVRECYYNYYGNNYKPVLAEIANLLYIMDSEKITGLEYLLRLGRSA